MKVSRLFSIGLLLLLIGCGKDRTVDDYNRDQGLANLAQLKALEGEYTGLLYSQRDGAVLGALMLRLSAESQAGPAPSQPGASGGPSTAGTSTGQPILVTQISFKSEYDLNAAASKSSYDFRSGHFSAEVDITRQGSGSQGGSGQGGNGQGPAIVDTITIEGKISPDAIQGGVMQVRNFEGYGGNFDLVRHGESLDQLIQEHPPKPDQILLQKNYLGQVVFNRDKATTKNVNFVISRFPLTSDQELIGILMPIKQLQMTLSFGQDAQFLFQDASWDLRSGVLRATATQSLVRPNQTLPVTIFAKCQYFSNLSNQTPGFACDYSTSEKTSSASSNVQLAGDSQPGDPDPKPSPSREPVVRDYQGTGDFSDGTHDSFVFTAIYPARTHFDEILELFFPYTEKYLSVSFTYSRHTATVGFATAKFDERQLSLDAKDTIMVGNQTVQRILSCRNLDFFNRLKAPKSDFTCTYMNTNSGTYGNFHFHQ